MRDEDKGGGGGGGAGNRNSYAPPNPAVRGTMTE